MAKILMITDNLQKGGKERRLFELLRYLDTHTSQFEVELILLKDKVDYPDVYKLKNTSVNILKRVIKKDPTVFFKIWKICSQFKPDIIHSWGSMPSVYVFLIAFFYRIPLINAMIANSKCQVFSKEWFRLKLTYPFSNVILANSYSGLKAFNVNKKGKVIYNGFNFDRLSYLKNRSEVLAEFHIKTPYVIGMVAAFHPRKDYNTFLEVANEISKERNDITFMAIGEGTTRRALMDKYVGNKNILFTGVVHNVEHLMNCFDIGVLLTDSQHHLEGISNSILEMMAVGKPVIASRGGGTDEIVIPDRTGILIDPLSRKQFKESILRLIENKTLRDEFGINSKEEVKAKFSIEQMCSKTIELYNSLK